MYKNIIQKDMNKFIHCDICGKDFAFNRGLQRHIGNVHEVRKGQKSKRSTIFSLKFNSNLSKTLLTLPDLQLAFHRYEAIFAISIQNPNLFL